MTAGRPGAAAERDSHIADVTLLFTDIEGSTALWEREPDRMRIALARHNAVTDTAISTYRGTIVKLTGDGVYAAFDDPCDAVAATLHLLHTLADPAAFEGLDLRVRCGLHRGAVERWDGDLFGGTVNRAARIMSAAHGGQILLSHSVVSACEARLPPGSSLRELGLVRLRDLTHPERLYQLVHAKLPADFPRLRSLEGIPNNLPQQASSFVGRSHELSQLAALLRAGRLVTLVGTGGLGKTRLSLHLAADAMDDFPEGTWFIELAALTDPALVTQAVAVALGVKQGTDASMMDALARHVMDRRLLLILDNCEHLVAASADLAHRLLQAGPGVKILATSRERLHIGGETLFAVQPFAGPDDARGDCPARAHNESVQLFVERSAAAQPAFRLTPRNIATVNAICRRLDGIPLAIELAAARVRSLPLDTIAKRLGDRFQLLASGERVALPRQRTLRALIDWSYDLLAEPERLLFRRLAVFAGGWTLEAAEAVGAFGELEASRVLDCLTELVEKSLVVLDFDGGRYRMLETLREYGEDRLRQSGESEQARALHLAFYIDLAESAGAQLSGPDQDRWNVSLDAERENLLAAHAWCGGSPDRAEAGLRLVTPIPNYWLVRGLPGLWYDVTLEALARNGAQDRSAERMSALNAAGQLGYFTGHYEVRPLIEESLGIARELGDRQKVGSNLRLLGHICLGQDAHAQALVHYTEALELARKAGSRYALGVSLTSLAEFHFSRGDFDRAEPLYEESLAIDRELGDADGIGLDLMNLAAVAICRATAPLARSRLREALSVAEPIASRRTKLLVLDAAISLAALEEDWIRAARFDGATQIQRNDFGLNREPSAEAFVAPYLARTLAALGQADFDAAQAAGRGLNQDGVYTDLRKWLEPDDRQAR